MKETTIISLRISEQENVYLQDLANNLALQKRGSTEISPAKALKILLDYCLINQISPVGRHQNPLQEIRKMVEQIHASIPHLMYQNYYQSLALSAKIDDESNNTIKQKSVEYLNTNLSGFQSVTYKEVKFKLNGLGLKTIPIEQGESLWA